MWFFVAVGDWLLEGIELIVAGSDALLMSSSSVLIMLL
ncbi:hypothetical protein Pchl3084_0227 [Pseudomonas chlororaphis subsp. aureofaciens 30-84]|nr:hypothetical protein Pchl3084_0227 [Pseudomonas chlororaphis subsp. aureofaciens 30-84]